MKRHDVIIIGGGPGGSVLATLLAQKGYDVGVFEREVYPRFHIGESLLPSTMPLFKKIGFFPTLDSGKYIRKFGARFVDYRVEEEIYFGFEDGFNPNIPFAFEVPRAEFDKDLLEHARKSGATIYQPERVKDVKFLEDKVQLTSNKGDYEARFVCDATGRESILGKHFKLKKMNQDLNNVGVFSHFTGVKRNAGRNEGDILIGLLPHQAWSWVIPFQGDRTSVGVVSNVQHFRATADLGQYLQDAFSSSPILRDYMKEAERVQEINLISNYSHRCETFAGDRWMLVGDAAIFLDPIFSSGVHVACTSASFAAEALDSAMKKNSTLTQEKLHTWYFENVMRGVDRFHKLISMFYHSNFVGDMKKVLTLEKTRQAYTSAVAGDMWNDENIIFKMKVL